ncbi:MAG: hypothetical protein FVQ81_16495 [Candidatus Glassbacteria bacterium]|nr:hypothetical protein [Candidatus Glassbacteria bacterium]
MTRHALMAIVIAGVALAAVAACTKTNFRPVDPTRIYESTESLRMFRNFPDVPYIEIGTLRAVGPNKDKLLKSIRKRAMKIGAQAIVVKPTAERSNEYVSRQRGSEFSKVEYIMEAVALRFPPPEE